jgi:hypothetical protein
MSVGSILGALATPRTKPALFTITSISLKSEGRFDTKDDISLVLVMSRCTQWILTLGLMDLLILAEIRWRLSMRRAVRISFRELGEVRANSSAQDFPMPLDAPVMRIVLPDRRLPIAEAILSVDLERKEVHGF